MNLSIIIPAINEEIALGHLAASLAREAGDGVEIILADGGSSDGTVEVARLAGWRIVGSKQGRGTQMNAGARVASGKVLLFLHADTRLPVDGIEKICEAMEDERVVGGNFSLGFDGGSREAEWLTRIYPMLRLGGMCYGDSAFFIRREIFESIGGYRDYPLFEDCDLYRRVRRRGRFVTLAAVATTSSRRFEGRFFRTFALWMLLQGLYWIGVSPQLLGRIYYRARSRAG